jgi:hypothetical protein
VTSPLLRPRTPAASLTLSLLLLAAPAQADVLTLRDGWTIEGEVRETRRGYEVVLRGGSSVFYERDEVRRVVQEAPPWETFEARLGQLQPGQLEPARELSRYALDHHLVDRAVEPLQAALRPGDARQARDLARFCLTTDGLRSRAADVLLSSLREGDLTESQEAARLVARQRQPGGDLLLLQVVAVGDLSGALEQARVARELGLARSATPALARRALGGGAPAPLWPSDAAELGLLCVEVQAEAEARRLLLLAVEREPDLAAALRGLRALDFHRVDGTWQAPEVYYPAQGYVQFEGRWALPEERDLVAAQRGLERAGRAQAQAEAALARIERVVDQGLELIAVAEGGLARAAADVDLARAALSSREADLGRAQTSLDAARRDHDAWLTCRPRRDADATRWRWRRDELQRLVCDAERAVRRCVEARDQALGRLEGTLARQAWADGAVAGARAAAGQAEADLPGAIDRVGSARSERAQAERRAAEAERALARERARRGLG